MQLGISFHEDDEDDEFNPNINPYEGYIPVCMNCSQDFDEFKKMAMMEDMKVELKHSNSCLWHDWFYAKIKSVYPKAKIVRRK